MKKRATIKDVAKEAGVSIATVSYVINKKRRVGSDTEAIVKEAIKRLNYVPDISARSLVSKSSRLIGIVIPQMEASDLLMFNNPFYSELLEAIEYSIRQNDYQMIVSGTNINKKYMDMALERNMDGIIAIGMYDDHFYQDLQRTNIPLVLVDSYTMDDQFDSVRLDDCYGGYLATEHLIKKNHRHIALVTGHIDSGGVIGERYRGYCQALTAYDIDFCQNYILEGNIDYEAGIRAAKLVKQQSVSAVFVTADIVGLGLIKGLKELGLRIPEDISVIGFDDVYLSKMMEPSLTTIKQDIFGKGEQAVDLLFQAIEKGGRNYSRQPKQKIIMPIEIVERQTVKELEG